MTTKKPRRRTVSNPASQEDLISQFEAGEGVSKKSRQMLNDLKERDKSKESEVHDDPIFKTASELDRILVDYIQPQPENPRYLPVMFSKKQDEESIAALTDCVVCEKGVLENRLTKNNPRYEFVNEEIHEILALAETLKHSDLVHPIVVWRKNMSDYPIVSGHRRYYAIRYLYGGLIKVRVKVYHHRPENLNVLRHIENFSRSDLTPPDALTSYSNAVIELKELEGAKIDHDRLKVVTSYLGISRASFYRYDKLFEYRKAVLPLLEQKIVTNIRDLYAEISSAEEQGREVAMSYLQRLLDNRKFSKFLQPTESKKQGRAKQYISLPKVKVDQAPAIRRLLTENVTQLDLGIDWEEVDFNNPQQVELVLKEVFKNLTKK